MFTGNFIIDKLFYFKPYSLMLYYLISIRCTLCQDMNEYSKIVCQNDKTNIIPIGIAERKLMEHILLELYRQKNIIKLIGDFPTQEIVSDTFKLLCSNVII